MDPTTHPPSAADRDRRLGDDSDEGSAVPGFLVVFSEGRPRARVVPIGGPVEVGRGGDEQPGVLNDGRVSRRHARIAFEAGLPVVTDLGSQNGTFVDGERAIAHVPWRAHRVVRIGDSLLVPLADVRAHQRDPVREVDGFVRGSRMQAVLEAAGRAARSGAVLHVRGETGSGKEGVVHSFVAAGPRAGGPLVAVNCAAVPPALAERLLFGARRGAYSGIAADATGYVEDADGGTLFLDEVAELDLQVQAKLLRVLETKEVVPLGASRPRRVDFALASATHRDLRARTDSGAFRGDLYFRIGHPAVDVPALRDRPEEIAALVVRELDRLPAPLAAHVSLVEQCLLRAWPGNVRELLAEVRTAAIAAASAGARVGARHLAASAGAVLGPGARGPLAVLRSSRRRMPGDDAEWRRRIAQALRDHGGNVSATARAFGLHRTQLRRLVERHGLCDRPEPSELATEDQDGVDVERGLPPAGD